jgi:hypothetical protein
VTQCEPVLIRVIQSYLQERIHLASHGESAFISDVLASWLGKTLLKLFADPTEAVRSAAVRFFLTSIEQGPDSVLQLLPYVIPVLEERLQAQQFPSVPAERSEEMRSSMLQVRLCHPQKALHAHLSILSVQANHAHHSWFAST